MSALPGGACITAHFHRSSLRCRTACERHFSLAVSVNTAPKGLGPVSVCLLCNRLQRGSLPKPSTGLSKSALDFRLHAQNFSTAASEQISNEDIAALCASLGAEIPDGVGAEAQQDALRIELTNTVTSLERQGLSWSTTSQLADVIIACEALGIAWNGLLTEAEATFDEAALLQLSPRQLCQLALACCERCVFSPLTHTLLAHLSSSSHSGIPPTLALPLLQQLLNSYSQLPHDCIQLLSVKCASSLQGHILQLSGRQIALLVCSLGVLQPEGIELELLLELSQRFGVCLKDAEGESISRVLVGFARLGWRPPLLIQQVVSHLNRRPALLQQFSTSDLVHLLWALARLHASGPPTLNLIKTTSILLLLDHTAPSRYQPTPASTLNPGSDGAALDSPAAGELRVATSSSLRNPQNSTSTLGVLQAAAMQFATNIMTAANAMTKPSPSFPSASAAAAAAASQARPTAANTPPPTLPPADLFDAAMFTADLPAAIAVGRTPLPTTNATASAAASIIPSSNSTAASFTPSSNSTPASFTPSSSSTTASFTPSSSSTTASFTPSSSSTTASLTPSSSSTTASFTPSSSSTTAPFTSSPTSTAAPPTSPTPAASTTSSRASVSVPSTAALTLKAPRRRLAAKELSVVAWACVKCGYSNKTLLSQLLRLLMAAAPAASAPSGLQPMVLSQVAWACGHLKFWQPGVEEWLEAHLMEELREGRVGSQTMAMVAWGMAACGKRPSAQFSQALLDASTVSMGDFEPWQLSALAWALAGWKLDLTSSFREAAFRYLEARSDSFSMRDLCSTVMSLDRLLPSLPHSLLASLEQKLQPHLHPLHYTALSWFLFCCQRNNYRPTHLIPLLCQSACEYLTGVSTIELQQLAPRYEAEARKLGTKEKADVRRWPTQLAALVFGLGCHAGWVLKGGGGDKQALEKVMALAELEASRRPALLPPGALAGLLWGMSEAQHAPSAWLQRGLHRAVRRRVPTMSFKDLSLTLMALSRWHQQRHMELSHVAYAQAPAINRLLVLLCNMEQNVSLPRQTGLTASSLQYGTQGNGTQGGSSVLQSVGGATLGDSGVAGIRRALVGRDEELKPHVLVDVAVALSHLPCYNSRLINNISVCTLSSLEAFNGRTLTALLAALATLRHDEPRLLRAVSHAYPSYPKWRLPNLGSVQRLLSVYAKLNHQPGDHVLQAAHEAVQRLHVLERLHHMAYDACGSSARGNMAAGSTDRGIIVAGSTDRGNLPTGSTGSNGPSNSGTNGGSFGDASLQTSTSFDDAGTLNGGINARPVNGAMASASGSSPVAVSSRSTQSTGGVGADRGVGGAGNNLAAKLDQGEGLNGEEIFSSGDEWEAVWPARVAESERLQNGGNIISSSSDELWESEGVSVGRARSVDAASVDNNGQESGVMYYDASAVSSSGSSSRGLGINESNSFAAPSNSRRSLESNVGVASMASNGWWVESGNGSSSSSSVGTSTADDTRALWTERDEAGGADMSEQPSTSGRTQHSRAQRPLSRHDINTICTLMYYLALMRQHNSHLSNDLGAPLAAILESDPKLLQASGRWAGACLLLATADGTFSPFHSLSQRSQERCLQLWRQHVKRESRPRSSYPVLRDICKVLQSAFGLQTKASHFTTDAATTVDISFQYAGRLMALELLLPGRNCCRNTLRLSGQGSLKRRLQQARGYHVLYISRKSWTEMGADWVAKTRFMRKVLNGVPGRQHLGAFDEVHIVEGEGLEGREQSTGREGREGMGPGEGGGVTPALWPPPSIGTSRIPDLVQTPLLPLDGANQTASDTLQPSVWLTTSRRPDGVDAESSRRAKPARLRLQSALSAGGY